MKSGKKVSLYHFLADQKIPILWKKCVLGCPIQTYLVYAVGVEDYTFEALTTHLRLHYTNYTNDFVSATR